MRSLFIIFSLLFSLSVTAAEIGVVFLHAKGSSPDSKHTSSLIGSMKDAGMTVAQPELPWSGSRGYDASYMDAMNEVENEVKKLQASGVKSIFIAGHSMGANGAIGYGAHKGGIDGVIAIAPGHVPEVKGYRKKLKGSPDKAAEMVAAGRGAEKDDFNDLNQGSRSTLHTTAAIYDSFFSDSGPAVMPSNAFQLKAPLFWVVGEDDRMAKRGTGYAYDNAPANPHNEYLVVGGGHKDTPEEAQSQVVAWIKKVHAAKK